MIAMPTTNEHAGAAEPSPMEKARRAFLETGKPSLSIRKREVLPRDDLDERLKAAIAAYQQAL